MSTKMSKVRWLQDSGSIVEINKEIYPLYLNEEFEAPVNHEFFKSALSDGHCELIKNTTTSTENK